MHGRVKLPGQAHSLCIHSSRIFLGMESDSVLVFLILGKGDIVQQKVKDFMIRDGSIILQNLNVKF